MTEKQKELYQADKMVEYITDLRNQIEELKLINKEQAKQLTIPNVSQQSELLQCFCKLANITYDTVNRDIEETIYRFNAL